MIIRYIINGITATIIHYGVLEFNINILKFHSAGIANIIASSVGISMSFLGNRYYVFQDKYVKIIPQLIKFGVLYGILAILHFIVLLIWTDFNGLDYRIGFLLATSMQLLISYYI